MIHYRLRCGNGHEFEGWFRSSGSFEEQAGRGLLSCPNCGTSAVDRGMMAPAVRTARARPVPEPAVAAPQPAAPPPPGKNALPVPPVPPMPDALRAGLQKLRVAIERDCENMGDRFADEAIRMHQGDAERRGIYGSTTEGDREALAEAGVEVVSIPWLRPADS